ncbi:MAG: hypothetical protein M1570_12295 [Chloroflexi bacterium]|nr:hypothetical protein [Chloroflexota bacterium]
MANRVVLVFALAAVAAVAGEPGGSARYLGGTVDSLHANAGGKVLTADHDSFIFVSQNATVRIPYARIDTIEYGQDVGRRVVLAWVISPMFLLLKARKHFITLGYRDESDKHQAMVLRVDKNFVRSALATLEARTGRSVTYQDEEARKFRRN